MAVLESVGGFMECRQGVCLRFGLALLLVVPLGAIAQSISIDSPADQSPIAPAATLDVTWTLHTRCSVKNATITEVRVDGVLQSCSGACSGAGGTITLLSRKRRSNSSRRWRTGTGRS